MAQSGGQQAQADNAVGNHHVVQDGHFFAEQLVALGLHDEKFQPALQGLFQLRRVPRFGDVFVNRAAVDGGDRGVHVRVGGDQHADDARTELPGAFQQPHALFAGHPLVGHQQADFIGVFLQQFEAVLRGRRRHDAELFPEGAREIGQ